ncbi:hypothetical protein SCLCIDRAFT_22599 [Scleroderma citrinum Foug A]|uniref:Uncharacterized protein n=1 Tax=Scleroderma citrinum Foug A TaxID=1036808 RepID=A0A0C3ECQ3_9AGAM|nr:hypothetical protein SCLCIDRAFT_22599 [Scleroderma citrinum Foug A]
MSHIFQYLFKYIHKTPDHTRYHIGDTSADEPINEIHDYQDAHYFSGGEATWRILGFHVTKKDPAVTSLPVHLPEYRSHHQYLRTTTSTSMVSLLDRYFQRPIGNFTDTSGIHHAFSDLTYAEYFTLFCLTHFDIHHANDHQYFCEHASDSHDAPLMHVVQRDITHLHLSCIDAIRPSQGELFYLHAILQSWSALSFIDHAL